MKKMNSKGFTLIELLAVIVVLAVIMVIATQQVNATIKKSRANSFVSSYKMIVKEIKSRTVMRDFDSSESATVECTGATCYTSYDISKDDYIMTVESDGKGGYNLTLTGTGKFANMALGNQEAVKCPVENACTTDAGTKQTTISVNIDKDGQVTAH